MSFTLGFLSVEEWNLALAGFIAVWSVIIWRRQQSFRADLERELASHSTRFGLVAERRITAVERIYAETLQLMHDVAEYPSMHQSGPADGISPVDMYEDYSAYRKRVQLDRYLFTAREQKWQDSILRSVRSFIRVIIDGKLAKPLSPQALTSSMQGSRL